MTYDKREWHQDQIGSADFWRECIQEAESNREFLNDLATVSEVQSMIDHYVGMCRRMVAMLEVEDENS